MWTAKGLHPVDEHSTSPNSELSSLLSGMTPDMLSDSAPTAQESNFIDSLFAGIGLDDDEPAASPARLPPSMMSATPPPSSSPPEPSGRPAGKPETIEEWTARKEKESRAIGSWFNFDGDEPLEKGEP